ncbi:methyltransferase domain-containing protein [Thermovibrio sp.]
MKERIKRNFSLAAKEYEEVAELQLEAGERLLRRLNLIDKLLPLLDLGAGTGKLTPEGGICLDIAPEMTKRCREKGRVAVCGDAERIPFKDESFKTVISNFALQWTQVERSFREAYRVLKSGGYFLLSIPVEGSLKILFKCWKDVGSSLPLFKFPDEEKVFAELSRLFEIIEFERVYLRKVFKSPKEALKAVNRTGARNPFGRPKRGELLRFLEVYSKEPVIEYDVLILTARKT